MLEITHLQKELLIKGPKDAVERFGKALREKGLFVQPLLAKTTLAPGHSAVVLPLDSVWYQVFAPVFPPAFSTWVTEVFDDTSCSPAYLVLPQQEEGATPLHLMCLVYHRLLQAGQHAMAEGFLNTVQQEVLHGIGTRMTEASREHCLSIATRYITLYGASEQQQCKSQKRKKRASHQRKKNA